MESSLTVIIPTWNIIKRGYNRLDLVLHSLSLQSVKPERILVSDGSDKAGIEQIRKVVANYPDVELLHTMQSGMMNMPALYNRAASITDTNYLFFTGADFVYGPNFINNLKSLAHPDKMIFASTKMGGPAGRFTKDNISKWTGDWTMRAAPEDRIRSVRRWGCWGEKAPGKQMFSRELFAATRGFDERFVGISAFDTDMAFRIGEIFTKLERPIKKEWTHTPDCWHIWHKPYKLEGEMGKTRKKNHSRIYALQEDWKENHERYAKQGIKAYDWTTRKF